MPCIVPCLVETNSNLQARYRLGVMKPVTENCNSPSPQHSVVTTGTYRIRTLEPPRSLFARAFCERGHKRHNAMCVCVLAMVADHPELAAFAVSEPLHAQSPLCSGPSTRCQEDDKSEEVSHAESSRPVRMYLNMRSIACRA
jgi:hypothetical protein